MYGYPQISFWIPTALAQDLLFPRNFKPGKNTFILMGTIQKIKPSLRINLPSYKQANLEISEFSLYSWKNPRFFSYQCKADCLQST